jgi:NADPH-dependent curcumin reductase CurA
MAKMNRQVTLGSRPAGFPELSDFRLDSLPLPSVREGEVLVRSVFLSLDPYMRGRMSDAPSYAPPLRIGEVMTGAAVGIVVESRAAAFVPGDAVVGMLGWQEYAALPGGELRHVDPALAPISTALGVLGMPGLTAYFGLLDIGDPKAGETVVISGAAGAVGMVAGQVAKIKGCRVVGVAGSDAKVAWLVDSLGFDAAFNYRMAPDLGSKVESLCPDGVDVYFDNVGGEITDAVMRAINPGARIAVCGQISQYNLLKPEPGPRWMGQLIVKQAKVQGFLVSGYAARFPEGLDEMARWLKQGKLKYREDIARGLESAPEAFIGMLRGKNEGKQLVRLSDA